jgi:putative ABC transport system substrate-binding protein
MNRRTFLSALSGSLLAAPLAAEAQQVAKVYRIGILTTVAAEQVSGPTPSNPHVRALVQRLGELGWVYGRNLVTEPRGAEGKLDRFPALAEELVRTGVDVIVTAGGNPAALAAQRTTSTIAVVMATSGDPVGAGLVSSLARPGGNITGMSVDAGPEIYAKRLALLREAAPGITRIGVISRRGGQEQRWHKVLTRAAESVRIALVHATVGATSDYPAAFATVTRERVDALLASDTSLNRHNHRLIIDFAAGQRLPTIYAFRESVEAGGLLAYGVDFVAIYRRAGEYVDRVLRGTRPADLPIEQPTKFELVINLKTAKALGLTIPPALLQQADQGIE